jgi:flap endonuclease-1
LHGRKIAIDASMAIYQFLIAVRAGGGSGQQSFMLTNAEGETTSHIQGMFNRTIRFLGEGIRPVFVFDGKPPDVKSHELLKRREKRSKAQAALQVATEENNVQELDKQSKRLVVAGQKENADCQKLLQLMGVPVVLAPCEAEAQASAMAKAGLVYATGTEDMDALTFQTPILVRKMTFANASKSVVQTIHYAKAMEGLGLSQTEFVDLCILLGCDYCDTIKGVGPKTALKLIRDHKCIENILQNLDRKKYTVPESWEPNRVKEKETGAAALDVSDEDEEESVSPADTADAAAAATATSSSDQQQPQAIPAYKEARRLFNEHEVDLNLDLKWTAPKVEELTSYLVNDCGFSADRVSNSITKLKDAFKANSKPQMRMDSFFKAKPKPAGASTTASAKRQTDSKAAASKNKKAKVAAGKKK